MPQSKDQFSASEQFYSFANAADVLPDMLTLGENLFMSTLHIQAQFAQTVLRFNLEAARFAVQRMESDLKVAEHLLETRSFTDIDDTGYELVRKVVDDYADETGKMVELGADLANKTAGRVSEEAVCAARI